MRGCTGGSSKGGVRGERRREGLCVNSSDSPSALTLEIQKIINNDEGRIARFVAIVQCLGHEVGQAAGRDALQGAGYDVHPHRCDVEGRAVGAVRRSQSERER